MELEIPINFMVCNIIWTPHVYMYEYVTERRCFPMILNIGATAGSSDDWSKGGAGIPYAYTVELRDEGRYGFELPAR